MNRICYTCGNTTFGPEDKFCYRCGSEAVPVGSCVCGRDLSPHDKFCPKCGTLVPRTK